VSTAQIREAIPDCQAFVDRLPALKVVIFCGRSARLALPLLRLPPQVRSLTTFHPGAQSYNHQKNRDDIHATFAEARRLIGDPVAL
jgi:hypothetical protein